MENRYDTKVYNTKLLYSSNCTIDNSIGLNTSYPAHYSLSHVIHNSSPYHKDSLLGQNVKMINSKDFDAYLKTLSLECKLPPLGRVWFWVQAESSQKPFKKSSS